MSVKKSTAFLVILLAAASLGVVAANPISLPMVKVVSPQNNCVYTTNAVGLNFSAWQYSAYNFSSYSYSLDGQPAKATDGYTLLTDLSPGSHVVEIYGNGSWAGTSEKQNMFLARVYFSNVYSTAWVTFTAVSTVFAALVSFAVFMNRKNISARLRSEKTGNFWLGIVCFAASIVALVPSAWWYIDLYLFPRYPRGFSIPPLPFLVLSFVGLVVSFALMAYGTRRKGA
jgi:hypothetical protein